MAYCPRCGVEVEDRLPQCPLCETRIPDEVRDPTADDGDYPGDVVPPRRLYRSLSAAQKKLLSALIIGFLTVFPSLLSLGINYTIDGEISWSYFVVVPVFGAGLITWLALRMYKRPFLMLSEILGLLLLVQVLLELRLFGTSLFSSPVSVSFLPYLVPLVIALELLFFYLTRRRRRIIELLQIFTFSTAALVVVIDLFLTGWMGWSLIVDSVLVSLGFYFVVVQHVKKRGVNLVAFFFLDLAVMLLLLDLSISGSPSWSLITGLIFLPIAALFYLLDLALFRDINWKKALHL